MSETLTEGVTVSRSDLLELAATVEAVIDLMTSLGKDGEPEPICAGLGVYAALDNLDRCLGITWGEGEEAHDVYEHADWRAYQARGAELAADALDAIVADPYEDFMPRGMSRKDLHQEALRQRKWAEDFRAKYGDEAPGDEADQ